ncbi:hypothetical protein B0H17DRAFT_1029588 [Mycena rosella]|uniref:DUF4211 domain-containing protein n=1 Tax=Mycena rosella TaxID=1033263 RepID=A0AAD7MBZ7_MYCRO|nr:hypothetical protein B0H17DRAFT_1029588 [Mycena rosella]
MSQKTKSNGRTTTLQQATLLGGIARPSGLFPPRPMRMEVYITTPAYLKRCKPLAVSSNSAKESNLSLKQITSTEGVECAKAIINNDETAPPPRKRKTSQVAQSESEDEAPPRRKRKTKRIRRSPFCEEKCSGDEVEPEHIIESRLRTRGKLSRRDFILLKLKRKRQGLSPPKTESEPESSGESDSSNERDSLFDGSSSDSAGSSEFIVEDDGTAVAQLPMEFSMETHEDLSRQFKKIFQFMVHIAIRPQAEREQFMRRLLETEAYFSVPLKMARRRISGLRGSLIASSRWQPAFIALLERYPEFELKDLVRISPACDACRISARKGSKKGELSGYEYNRMGFMETEHRKPKNFSFNLGRFCAERTEVFHQFTHWEFKLFTSVSQEVDQLHEVAQAGGYVNDRDEFVSVKVGKKVKPGTQVYHDMQDAVSNSIAIAAFPDRLGRMVSTTG